MYKQLLCRQFLCEQWQPFFRNALVAGLMTLLPVMSALAAAPAFYYSGPRCDANDQIVVGFREGAGYAALDVSTVTNIANFSIPGRTVTNAAFNSGGNNVILTLNSPLSNLTRYTLNVANVRDINGVSISSASDWFYYSSNGTGLVGEYYTNKSLSGGFSVSRDDTVDKVFASGIFCFLFPDFCGGDVSVRWKGFLTAPQNGSYDFSTISNDGSRLWVGDMASPIINYWGQDRSNSVTQSSNNHQLSAGKVYPIRQEYYFDRQGFIFYDSGEINLRWDPPGGFTQTIPASALSSCVAVDDLSALDQFQIAVPAQASACSVAQVTVTAMNSSGERVADYLGAITLNTSDDRGDWSLVTGNGVLDNGSGQDGQAIYTFNASEQGVVTFALNHPYEGSASVSVESAVDSVVNTSSEIEFLNAGIAIVDDSGYNWDVIAGRDHPLKVEYSLLNAEKEVCETTDYTGLVPLKFWLTPTADHPASATLPSLTNGVINPLLGTVAGSPLSLPVNIVNGVGNLTLRTSDVGDFDLRVLDDLSGFVTNLLGLPVALPVGLQEKGSPITVRPFGLRVGVTDNVWNTLHASSGLDASLGEGPAFQTAGSPFTVTVAGVTYDAADDLDGDGLPDGFGDSNPATLSDLSNNTVTPSFGLEGAVVNLAGSLAAPAGGFPGVLAGTLGGFSNGAGSGQFTYSEVGIIELAARTPLPYLNSGVNLLGASGYVGRFVPHHFDVISNSVGLTDGWLDSDGDGNNDWSCDFTYFGQSFALDQAPELTFTALNLSRQITRNYAGHFNKFSSATGVLVDTALPVTSNSELTLPSTPAAVVADSLTPGQFIQTVSGYSEAPYRIYYSKPVVPGAGEVPFDAQLELVFPDNSGAGLSDQDGVCFQQDDNGDGVMDGCRAFRIADIGGTELRYGRLNIDNQFGPEINELIMPFRSEFWTTVAGMTGFYVNRSDSEAGCSGTVGLAAGMAFDALTQGNLNGYTSATFEQLAGGLGRVILSAPGAGHDGQVTIGLTGPDFLRFDFDGDGTPEDAAATGTFGIYGDRGVPVIYRQQSYR